MVVMLDDYLIFLCVQDLLYQCSVRNTFMLRFGTIQSLKTICLLLWRVLSSGYLIRLEITIGDLVQTFWSS
jgi:hypothetical protein